MIETKTARTLMNRFRGMPMEPKDDEIIKQRVAALSRHARNESHAVMVVEHLAGILQFFPVEADIVQACTYVEDPKGAAAIERAKTCRYCQGDGWRTLEGPFWTSAAYPCDHSGRPPERLGVAMARSVQSMYQREHRIASARRRAWKTAGGKEFTSKGMTRITKEDIDRAMQELGL